MAKLADTIIFGKLRVLRNIIVNKLVVNQIDGKNNHRIRFDSNVSWLEFTDQNNNRSDIVTNDTYVNSLNGGTWLGSLSKSDIGLSNVPNEDATNPYNLDQSNASDGQALAWSSANNRYEPQTISQSLVLAQYSSTDTTTELNNSTPNPVPWDTTLISHSSINNTNSADNTEIQVTESGTYILSFSVSMNSSSARIGPEIQFRINGTIDSRKALHTYIRAASGHNDSSGTLTMAFELNANDLIEVVGSTRASSGSASLNGSESVFMIHKVG